MEGINVVFITKNNNPSLSFCLPLSLYISLALFFSFLKDDISAMVGVRCKVTAARQMTNDLKMATSSVL